MCGIYFCSSKSPNKIPKWVPNSYAENPASRFNVAGGVELTAPAINELITQDLAGDAVLSEDDKNKVANVERLRELQSHLNAYKNTQHKHDHREKAESIAAEMASLSERPTVSEMGSFSELPKGPEDTLKAVLARGPDFAQLYNFLNHGIHVQLFSSVLSLRQPFTAQPLVNHDWVLQFNGELYEERCVNGNDTVFVMEQLVSELARKSQTQAEAVAAVIGRLNGEFAYVLTNLSDDKVYFGKDSVGKRSLLFELSNERLTISSVFPNTATQAIECKGSKMYEADLRTFSVKSTLLHPHAPRAIAGAEHALENSAVDVLCRTLHSHLQKACDIRQSTIHPLHPHSKDARIGILFSGGLDCTVLAAIIAENFTGRHEPCVVDLLTVGFENPRTGLPAASSPDRILSEQSWFELCKLTQDSDVEFRLVQIDVPYTEWLAHRLRVQKLIYPCSTEMDLSIAIAFYFAARAENCELLRMNCDIKTTSLTELRLNRDMYITRKRGYSSLAKVLFSGLGADELFGGYSRHENLFHGLQEHSPRDEICKRYDELSHSLLHDIDVIYERNLGRDDRAMSSWGKELRYPYLDQEFIDWVVQDIAPQLKVQFEWVTQSTKKGEKRVMKFERKYILRRLAQDLGLKLASREIKRAIQFGAKSAKMEIGQQRARGTDVL